MRLRHLLPLALLLPVGCPDSPPPAPPLEDERFAAALAQGTRLAERSLADYERTLSLVGQEGDCAQVRDAVVKHLEAATGALGPEVRGLQQALERLRPEQQRALLERVFGPGGVVAERMARVQQGDRQLLTTFAQRCPQEASQVEEAMQSYVAAMGPQAGR